MAGSCKLRIAQFLMIIGVAPMVLAITYIATVIYFAQSHPGQGGGSDAFLLIAMLLFGFATSLFLGATGALWSWRLTKRGLGELSTATIVLQTMVAVALLGPLLWYVSLFFH